MSVESFMLSFIAVAGWSYQEFYQSGNPDYQWIGVAEQAQSLGSWWWTSRIRQ